jgi:poly-gamma-glutamate synthesis protein (capsule biosynthesis protein)
MQRPHHLRIRHLSLLPVVLVALVGAWSIDASGTKSVNSAAKLTLEAYPWVYQRSPAQAVKTQTFDVLLVGDVQAGRGGQTSLPARLPAEFQAADLLVGNLEGVISSLPPPSVPAYEPYRLAADPAAAWELSRLGFDLLGLANNHALDLGAAGLQATTQNLARAGIRVVGAGASSQQAQQAVFYQLGNLRIAFLAVTAISPVELESASGGWVPAVWQPEIMQTVRQARQAADLVIVMLHWGFEYQAQVDPAQRSLAQSLFEAGADLVVGHHPHVTQSLEWFTRQGSTNPQLAAYSLGNFWFTQEAPGTDQGLVLRLVLDSQGIQGIQALPVNAGHSITLVSPAEAQSSLQRLLQPPPPTVIQCDRQACALSASTDTPPRQESGGIFWSGSIELTGEAPLELVRRDAGQIIVYEQGQESWRTPPEWDILDAALGDPEADGRNEIMLALLKPDESGELRSHPFIMGFRGGIYRNLWGGSAVGDPIQELELGNVDDDPDQELIILEERDSGLNAVTVWDWHGWGFSLRWRSAEAAYHNLRLALDPQGGPSWIVVDAPVPYSTDTFLQP